MNIGARGQLAQVNIEPEKARRPNHTVRPGGMINDTWKIMI